MTQPRAASLLLVPAKPAVSKEERKKVKLEKLKNVMAAETQQPATAPRPIKAFQAAQQQPGGGGGNMI